MTAQTRTAQTQPATSAGPAGPAGTPSRRLRPDDASALSVLGGLAVIWILFQALNHNFLTPRNLSNLVLQIGVLGTLAAGLVLVLVLGEIDLSVGAIAGVCAGTMAVLLTQHAWPIWAALVVAITMGAAIGLVHGLGIVTVGVPSFIVTLAGLLVWQGVQLAVVGDAGQIQISSPFIKAIASSYLPRAVSWIVAAAVVSLYAVVQVRARRTRRCAGMPVERASRPAIRTTLLAALAVAIVAELNRYFGVPWVLVILLTLVFVVGLVLTETPFGRHLYAIGGNREAARRAGVKVRTVTVLVFVSVSTLASLAGVIEASRQFSVSNALGGGTLQLNAIAAVVIGGTSLFGGRGRAYHALLGALVVGSVQNGLDLLGQNSSVKNVSTGLILMLAVSVDAVARRRRLARGYGA
jgi:D-xylose transport system permease protein